MADDAPTARPRMTCRPRVVVVGGGFAGLAAVHSLRDADVDVMLFDRNPYSTFQPLLYQVAIGGLNPGDISYALRAIAGRAPHTRVRRAAVTGVEPANHRVRIEAGEVVEYDYLVLCCGVGANFFGVPGAEQHARTIYSRREAIGLRDLLFSTLEATAQGRPGAVEPVMVVVGAGPTGVELAGALAELRNVALPVLFPEIDVARVRVVLVEMTDHVLGAFAPKLRAYAADELRRRGVELRLGTAVSEVRQDGVVLSDGQLLPSAATVWSSGVKVGEDVPGWGLPQGLGGRIKVGEDMRVLGHPEIFAAGDVAASEQAPLPQLAQPAIQAGRHAGTQIRRLLNGQPTHPFVYRDKGTMATIGRKDAVLQLPNGLTLQGHIAWLLWVGVHIRSLMGGRNRLSTFANLAVRHFSWPGQLNVILGDPVSKRTP